MVGKWLLIIESVLLGLLITLSIPVWPIVVMMFGVTESTPSSQARRVYALVLAFPVVAIGSLIMAWRVDQHSPLRLLFMVLPVVHLVVLYLARVRH